MFLEVIATSLDDIKNINNSSADQIELCQAMEHGGYTPHYELIVQACTIAKKPVMVMVRHSNNGFNISSEEFAKIKNDIRFIKTTHAAGVVCGVLMKNNDIDMVAMAELISLAKPLRVTFHRAFDEVSNQNTGLKQLVKLGINTVLTSGGRDEVVKNVNNLQKLTKQKLPIKILVGGGINAENLPILLANGLTNIHVGKCVRYNNSFDEPINSSIIEQLLSLGN